MASASARSPRVLASGTGRWIVLFLVCVVLTASAGPAFAWKPYTHVYLAEQALDEATATGKVTIYRVDYATGQIKLDNLGNKIKVGEYALDPDMLWSLWTYPAQFRAGVRGPDAYLHPRLPAAIPSI